MSHCNLQISRMFSGIAAARTNCDYLAEIKKSPGWIHRARRSNRSQYPPYIPYITGDSQGIRCSRVLKYTEQRSGVKKKETELMAFLSVERMRLELV